MVQRGRPLVRRVQSAAELPTRQQIRHCVVAKASLHIFSRLPSAWRSYDSCILRGLDSAQTVATMVTTVCIGFRRSRSNRQYLWIKIFYAASSVAVVSSGRSTSLPFSNFAPARTSATRWGALTARQRDWAASISL